MTLSFSDNISSSICHIGKIIVMMTCLRLTERSGDDLVAIRIIEGNSVDDVPVPLKSEQLVARDSVPHLASSIITARNELVSRFVEGAVC